MSATGHGHVSATSVTDSGGDGDLISGSPAIFHLLAFTSLLSVCLCTSCVSVHVCLFPLSLSLSLSHLFLCIISSGAQYELLNFELIIVVYYMYTCIDKTMQIVLERGPIDDYRGPFTVAH